MKILTPKYAYHENCQVRCSLPREEKGKQIEKRLLSQSASLPTRLPTIKECDLPVNEKNSL